jgi:hypothetical protein
MTLISSILYIITTMECVGKFTLRLFLENVETEIQFEMNPIKRKLFKTAFPRRINNGGGN